MVRNQSPQSLDLAKKIKKVSLSAFVILAFSAYAGYEHFTRPASALSATSGAGASAARQGAAPAGNLKDGTYTGPEVDAYYGLVKVEATITAGKIADVKFLDYPHDRRTSVRINSFAVPNLQQEAIQVQTANVDIISGATLTSQAFKVSLQAALDSAKN